MKILQILSFKTQLKIEYFGRITATEKCLEFTLLEIDRGGEGRHPSRCFSWRSIKKTLKLDSKLSILAV